MFCICYLYVTFIMREVGSLFGVNLFLMTTFPTRGYNVVTRLLSVWCNLM